MRGRRSGLSHTPIPCGFRTELISRVLHPTRSIHLMSGPDAGIQSISPLRRLLRCKHKTRIAEDRKREAGDLPPCTHLPYEGCARYFFLKTGHRECVICRTIHDTLSSDFTYIHAWPAPLSFQERPFCAVCACAPGSGVPHFAVESKRKNKRKKRKREKESLDSPRKRSA